MSETQLACSACHAVKPADAFHRNASKDTGRHSACRLCANTARKLGRAANGRPPNKRAYNLSTRYGITTATEQEMLLAQGGVCAICTTPLARHHIDHDHKSGAVRGLLCARCNLGVGHLERAGFLEAALAYLAKHGSRN